MAPRGTPGWYDDPHTDNQLRWFDGDNWTVRTAPGGLDAAPVDVTEAVPALPDLGVGASSDRTNPSSEATLTVTPPQTPPELSNGREVLPDGAVIAETWRRVIAYGVDNIVINAVTFFALLPVSGELPYPLGHPRGSTLVVSVVVNIVVSAVYKVGFLTWKQATPGKTMLGMVVRRVGDPGLSVVDALKRQILEAVGTAATLVDGNLLYISLVDGIWLLFNPKRQTLHDKMAGTVVVLTSEMALTRR
jgi:uncharacterized RDD family membrane protein YckC